MLALMDLDRTSAKPPAMMINQLAGFGIYVNLTENSSNFTISWIYKDIVIYILLKYISTTLQTHR